MVKKVFCVLSIAIFTNVIAVAEPTIKVDERFELTSIAFRLAGAREFTYEYLEGYNQKINSYFKPYQSHKLIDFIKQIRERNGIGFDAVSNITSYLVIDNGKIIFHKNANLNKLFIEDTRWDRDVAEKFVFLLNAFYRDTKFNRFYRSNLSLYGYIEASMIKTMCEIKVSWFESFFGEKLQNANVIVSLVNGASNYSATLPLNDGSEVINVIVGCTSTEEPMFDDSHKNVIIHEFCHHFVNPVVDEYLDQLLPYAQKVYPHVKNMLNKWAYKSDTTMLYENFVRLSTHLYKNLEVDDYDMVSDELKGFVWMRNQKKYYNSQSFWVQNYFKDFMPQMVSYWEFMSGNIEKEINEFQMRHPRIVSIYPANNSIVDSKTDEIVVTFSHPMRKEVSSVRSNPQDTTLLFPNTMGRHWRDDFTFVIPVKLDKGKSYGILLTDDFFESYLFYKLQESYYLKFSTK